MRAVRCNFPGMALAAVLGFFALCPELGAPGQAHAAPAASGARAAGETSGEAAAPAGDNAQNTEADAAILAEPPQAGHAPLSPARGAIRLPSPVTAEAACETAPPLTPAAARAVAEARAWLKALSAAAASLPRGSEVLMGAVSAEERLALAAQLYTPLVTRGRAADKGRTATLRLLARPNSADDVAQALRNPELILARLRLLREMRGLLHALEARLPQAAGAGTAFKAKISQSAPFFAADRAAPPFFTDNDAPWDHERWNEAARMFDALWLAQNALRLSPEGWLARPEDLPLLEEAARSMPRSAAVRLLLAEAQLRRGLPQQCVASCNEALRLAPDMGRARYIRALAHWRLRQLALAEDDLNASLEDWHGQGPQEAEQARRLRARGAVRMLRRDHAGMCADFSAACSLGDCEGLGVARAQGHCLPPAPPPHPAPAHSP